MKSILVGGVPTPLKNMKVSWGYHSQYTEKYKMFQTTNQDYIFSAYIVTVHLYAFVSYRSTILNQTIEAPH